MKQPHPNRSKVPVGVGLIGLAALVIYWPALLGSDFFLDVYLTEVHPNLVAIERALSRGSLPFWEPGILLGYPLASNPQVGTFYPPHLLMLWLLPAARVAVWSSFAHTLMAGWSTRALARRAGVSEQGATVAALVYAASPFLAFYHQALHGLVVLAWAPLLVLLAWRAAESQSLRRWALVAIGSALQLYAGHLQFALYTQVLIGLVALYAAPEKRRMTQAGWAVAQGGVAVLLYGPQLTAAWRLWKDSLRHGLSSGDITSNLAVETLGLDDLVELIFPRFFGGPSLRDFWYPEYIGAAAVVLLLLGLRRALKEPGPLRIYAGILAGSVGWLALVHIPGLSDALLSIPGLSAFRAPGRVLAPALLVAAILAGAGLDAAVQAADRRKTLALAGGLALLALVVGLGAMDGVSPRDTEHDAALIAGLRRADGLLALAALVALAGGCLLAARSPKAGRWLIVAAVGVPTALVATRYTPTTDPEPSPLAKRLRNPKSQVRRILGVSTGDPNYLSTVPGPLGWPYGRHGGNPARASWTLVSNVGLANGLANLHGQSSLVPKRFVQRLLGDTPTLGYPLQVHPRYDPSLLARLGVTHVVTTRHGQMPFAQRPPVVLEKDGYLIHALPNPVPPARFYPSGDLSAAPIAATLTSEAAGSAVIEVNAPSEGLLVYAESWHAGWTAETQNGRQPVQLADELLIGVPLVAGQHTVELTYVPTDFGPGLPAAAFGVVLLLIAVWRRPAGAS